MEAWLFSADNVVLSNGAVGVKRECNICQAYVLLFSFRVNIGDLFFSDCSRYNYHSVLLAADLRFGPLGTVVSPCITTLSHLD